MTAAQPQTESSSSPSSVDFQCLLLPPGLEIGYLFDQIAKQLKQALLLTKGKMTYQNVIDMYEKQLCQVWLLTEDRKVVGCVVSEIVCYVSGKKVMRLILCGTEVGTTWNGNLETSMSEFEKFANDEECSSVTIEGRRGWGRVLPDYHEVSATFEKELQ